MLEMLSEMLPLLVSVTVLAELEWPTLIVPKLKDAGEAVALVIPFPVKLTVCGLFEAPSVNVSVPFVVPPRAGVNVTPTVQLDPAPRLDPQVLLEIAKPADAAILAIEMAVEPLVRVTLLGLLVV